ncbi:extracellular solute-binding protein [Rhodobacterales bacterium HKCCE2091]|nr:extracellular solute-binding protein [Rhodobacterales bacterium HKCCE2091]
MDRRQFSLGMGALAATGLGIPGLRAHAASPELIAAAEAEGQVVWYTTMIVDQAVRPLVAAFEERYPNITVEFSRAGSDETALKIINEGQADRMLGDVFDGVSTFASVMAAGFVEPYSPDSASDYSAQFKDPEGHWHALNFYFLTAVHNTDLLSAEDAPQTYQDLLDERWRGNMVWPVDATPVGAPGLIGNILLTMGEEDGMAYLQQLAGQGIVNMAASQRAVLDRVILGDFPIGLMCFNHHVAISQAQGAPIDWIRMEPVMASASLLGLVRNGPNPNAGRLLVDFILSREGQEVLASTGYLPTHPEVAALNPDLLATGPQPFDTTFMAPDIVEQNLADWVRITDELFL